MSHGGQPGSVQRDLAKALLQVREQLDELGASELFMIVLGRLLNAGDHAVAEIERLRKIAAHVPGRVYIAAKEAAGYGERVRPARRRA